MKKNKPAKFSIARIKPDTAPRVCCPRCSVSVVASQMESHMRVIHFTSYHPGSSVPPPRQRIALSSADHSSPSRMAPREMVKCPDCGCSILPKNLHKHQLKVHIATVTPRPTSIPDIHQRKESIIAARPRLTPVPAAVPRLPAAPKTRPSCRVVGSFRRTGVFYDDESFLVEVEGVFLGPAGSAAEGWQMIEEYKKKH